MPYKPGSDAAHVRTTEAALRHWDDRRQGDQKWVAMPPQNIAAQTYRQDALAWAIHDLERRGFPIGTAQVLEVGAAQGYGLRPFLVHGFRLDQLHGVELFEDRVERGREMMPGLDLRVGDGVAMPFGDASFDLVCEQYCFCHIPDESIPPKIAVEMLRIVKPGGYIMIQDWRLGSKSKQLTGVGQKRIREWFRVGSATSMVSRFPAKLWPPIGRPVSRLVPSFYPLLRLVPGATGSYLTLLRRER